ncbi:MAG: CoA-binding protein [Deltaproteobacteria bacterium]|nr:CoA-binding protein [Deltaproteobacteria bacterium]
MDPIEVIFNPETVAVVGASNDLTKWGAGIFARVLTSPSVKRLYPINKHQPLVQGVKAYRSLGELPEPIDFAAIVIPYPEVPQIIRDCVALGVKTALIITAGLGETGEAGAQLEREIVSTAQQAGLRMVGPNCMGHFNGINGFSTLRMTLQIEKGGIGVISQSGGFAMHILMAGLDMGVGFSKFVSVGNEADLHFEDFLAYMAEDEDTKVITGYIEGLRKGREFFRLAKETTKKKPVVVVKVGRTDAGAKAAKSHTSAVAGTDIVYDAAFKQAGVLRVDSVEELFDVASALLRQPLPEGNRVGIITSGGGFGCVVSDACERLGLKVAPLSRETIEKLNKILPDRWPHANPVDTVATGFVNATYDCIRPMMEDPNLDALLVIGGIGISALFPRFGADHLKAVLRQADNPNSLLDFAQQMFSSMEKQEIEGLDKLFEAMEKYKKPVIISTPINETIRRSQVFQKLQKNGVMMYATPERAATVVAKLVEYHQYLKNQ